MFKINSEDELLQLLKIVSQEAVNKSRKTLREAVDTAQERYMSNLRASENKYGVDLSEQEEEPAADQSAPADTEAAPEQEEEPAEETQASAIDPETLGVSFDSVIKDINTLGLKPKYIEAATFAWLAKKRLSGEEIYLKISTGAKPSLLGEINKN